MNTPIDRIDDDSPAPPPSDDSRAAEYVLGVLGADERRLVQARMAHDPAFAQQVQAWEQRFSPWLHDATTIEPSAHVWPRIRGQLGWAPVQATRRTLWNNAAFWRGVAGLATAAGIAAVVFGLNRSTVGPITPPGIEEPAAQPVTVLARDNGATGWIARIDAAQGKVLMVPVPAPDDAAGRVNELWIIPAGGAPKSLGFLSHDKAHTITVPPTLRAAMVAGATLAVTLEDQAGIPHAAPTGPIVASGAIASI